MDARLRGHDADLLTDALDLRIPLTIAVVFILQAGTAIWWAASIDAEAKFQQSRIANLEQGAERTTDFQAQMNDRLARIEERMTTESESLARIEKQLGTKRN